MIFSFVNTKGGCGKSTLAVHFAAWLEASKVKTLLIDTDKQANAASWVVWRKEEKLEPTPMCMRLYGQEILNEGPGHASNYQATVIDTKGTDSAGTRASMIISDMALVPVRVSDFDAAAIDDFLEMLNEVRSVNPKLKVKVFINQIDPRRRHPYKLIDHLESQGLEVLNSIIKARAAFSDALHGGTVFEIGNDEKARFEANHLFAEIMEEVAK